MRTKFKTKEETEARRKARAAGRPLPPETVVDYPPAFQFPFRAGPYIPPKVVVGTVVHDEHYGDVEVAGMTDTPIPWPGFKHNRGLHEGLMPIFFAGLVRAAVEEPEVVVAHYWGVTRYMVNKWKVSLAGSEDSDVVFSTLAVKRTDPEFRKKYGYA